MCVCPRALFATNIISSWNHDLCTHFSWWDLWWCETACNLCQVYMGSASTASSRFILQVKRVSAAIFWANCGCMYTTHKSWICLVHFGAPVKVPLYCPRTTRIQMRSVEACVLWSFAATYRTGLHKELGLPLDRPLLRVANSLSLSPSATDATLGTAIPSYTLSGFHAHIRWPSQYSSRMIPWTS